MKIILIMIVLNFFVYKFAFKQGVKREQKARLLRLNALKRILNTRE